MISNGEVYYSCPPGYSRTGVVMACTQCSSGYYSSGGKCLACPAGSYSNYGSSSCSKCPASTYSSNAASSYCYSCSYGQYSGVGQSSCSACPAGTYGYGSTCYACWYKEYSLPGSYSCSTCSTAQYISAGGICLSQLEITTCGVGYIYKPSSASCIAVPAGELLCLLIVDMYSRLLWVVFWCKVIILLFKLLGHIMLADLVNFLLLPQPTASRVNQEVWHRTTLPLLVRNVL